MPTPDLSRRLDVLRATRTTRHDVPDGASVFGAQGAALTKLERALQGVGSAWATVCPPHLHAKSSIVNLRRGVLTIGADDSAARFEIDRMLRTGGERELIRTSTASVRRVKVVLRSDSLREINM